MVRLPPRDWILGIGMAFAVGCIAGRQLFPTHRPHDASFLPQILDFVLLLAVVVSISYDLRQRRQAEQALAARNRLLEQQQAELEAQQTELTDTAECLTHANRLQVQASQRFEALFQGLPVACFCYNAEGRVLEWNRAFETLFELRGKNILQQPVWDVVSSPEYQEVNRRLIGRVCGFEHGTHLRDERFPKGHKTTLVQGGFIGIKAMERAPRTGSGFQS